MVGIYQLSIDNQLSIITNYQLYIDNPTHYPYCVFFGVGLITFCFQRLVTVKKSLQRRKHGCGAIPQRDEWFGWLQRRSNNINPDGNGGD